LDVDPNTNSSTYSNPSPYNVQNVDPGAATIGTDNLQWVAA